MINQPHYIYKYIIFLVGILILHSVGATAVTPTIVFNNFGDKVTLEPVNRDLKRYTTANGLLVQLNHRVLLKTEPDITKLELRHRFSFMDKVTLHYKAENFNFFVADLDQDAAIQDVLNQLSADPLIMLVQPDLLQIADKRHHQTGGAGHLNNANDTYLEKLDVKKLWRNSKGAGVRIAIIDDGFDLQHEEFAGSRIAFQYDVEESRLDASPKYPLDSHGTQVMGVIFAQHNGVGIDGIAPEAELIAIRHADTWTSRSLLGFYLAKMAQADIVNCSWTSPLLMQPVAEVIADLVVSGRQGLGTLVVFAAGNKRRQIQPGENEAGLPGVSVIGSINRNGDRMVKSNYGPLVKYYTYGDGIRTTALNNAYVLMRGTSVAAAISTGMAALILGHNNTIGLSALQKELSALISIDNRHGLNDGLE